MTTCVAVEVFPWLSVAVHVTVVEPTGKHPAGALLVKVTPGQLSAAVAPRLILQPKLSAAKHLKMFENV